MDESILQAQFVKLHHEDTRQSIGCLLTTLNAGIKTGGEYNAEINYTIDDPSHRNIIQNKIMELINRL